MCSNRIGQLCSAINIWFWCSGGGSEAGETKVAYGLTALDGWGFYTISEATATSARVSYNGNAPTQYSTCCGADITTGSATKATFKVKNNGKRH